MQHILGANQHGITLNKSHLLFYVNKKIAYTFELKRSGKLKNCAMNWHISQYIFGIAKWSYSMIYKQQNKALMSPEWLHHDKSRQMLLLVTLVYDIPIRNIVVCLVSFWIGIKQYK